MFPDMNMSTRFPCTPDNPECTPANRVPRAVWVSVNAGCPLSFWYRGLGLTTRGGIGIVQVYDTVGPGESTHTGGSLLFNEVNRRAFLTWCNERNVTELYLNAAGLPGCDSEANSTTRGALSSFITQLDAQGVDVQLLAGDSLGSGCPNSRPCRFLDCTRAAVALAGQLGAAARLKTEVNGIV
jgi:hypothetical protein